MATEVIVRFLAFACLAAYSLYGQSGKVAAPSAGFVFDQSAHTLRRISGIPGAALVGDPLDFGLTLLAAYVAPHLDSAFVLDSEGRPHIFRLSADAPAERAVNSLSAPVRIVFSPSGSAAALYSPGSIQVLKGLPDAPQVAAAISLHANLRARRPVSDALAVSDDGAYLLSSAGGPLELITVAGDNRQVLDSTAGTLAAFAPGGHDAAIVNSGKLTLILDVSGAATQRSFPGIAAPSALAFSPDGQKLFVASATGRAVTAIQVSTGDRSSLACDCAPAALVAMGSVFRLNELGAAPLWLLDTASDRGLFFVPAPTAAK
jgi:hypothetical protein